jgi:hypothetical protein
MLSYLRGVEAFLVVFLAPGYPVFRIAQPGIAHGVARVDVSTSSDLAPAHAWKLASDLSRFGEWLTIFGGWRSALPSTLGEGTRVSSCIKVKGFRKIIHWKVTRYEDPNTIELHGHGRGKTRAAVAVTVAADGHGSAFHLTADLTGGLLNGPIGRWVAQVLRSEVRKSLANLAALR